MKVCLSLILSLSVLIGLHTLTSNCLAVTITSSYFLPTMKHCTCCFRLLAYLSVADIYLSDSLPLRRLTLQLPTQSLQLHLTNRAYQDFITEYHGCIFVAYSHSSAFAIWKY